MIASPSLLALWALFASDATTLVAHPTPPPAPPGHTWNIEIPPPPPCLDPKDWTNVPSRRKKDERPVFRVWGRCSQGWEADLERGRAVLEDLWLPVTQLHGEPEEDWSDDVEPETFHRLNPDPAVDVYLVIRNEEHPRGDERLADGGAGLTFRESTALADLRAYTLTVAREAIRQEPHIQHALVNALARLLAQPSELDRPKEWFFDALGVWTETQVLAATAKPLVHDPMFKDGFQKMDPLLRFVPVSKAASSRASNQALFPLLTFLGKQIAVDAVTEKAAGAFQDPNWGLPPDKQLQGMLEAVEWKKHALDFALRNMNTELGGDKPIRPLYADDDPSFEREIKPPLFVDLEVNGRAAGNRPFAFRMDIPVMGARYFRLRPTASVQQFGLDWSTLTDAGAVALLVKQKGKNWTLEKPRVKEKYWCFAEASDRVEEVQVVVVNESPDPAKRVTGSLAVMSNARTCMPLAQASPLRWTFKVSEAAHYDQREGRYGTETVADEEGCFYKKELFQNVEVTKLLLLPRNGAPGTGRLYYEVISGEWKVTGTVTSRRDYENAEGAPCACRENGTGGFAGTGTFTSNEVIPMPGATPSTPMIPPSAAALLSDPTAMNPMLRQQARGTLVADTRTKKAWLELTLQGVTADMAVLDSCKDGAPPRKSPTAIQVRAEGRMTGETGAPIFTFEGSLPLTPEQAGFQRDENGGDGYVDIQDNRMIDGTSSWMGGKLKRERREDRPPH